MFKALSLHQNAGHIHPGDDHEFDRCAVRVFNPLHRYHHATSLRPHCSCALIHDRSRLLACACLCVSARRQALRAGKRPSDRQVYNAVNLSFFMVNFSQVLIQQIRTDTNNPDFSVVDLKAHFRGLKYVNETLKLLQEKPDPILIQHISTEIATLGSINAA